MIGYAIRLVHTAQQNINLWVLVTYCVCASMPCLPCQEFTGIIRGYSYHLKISVTAPWCILVICMHEMN